jgi:hypothetical protein
MIRIGLNGLWRQIYGLRWLPHVLAGWLSHVFYWGCYPGLLLEVATSIIMMMINNNIVNLTLLIKGWDESLTIVIGCFNKSLPTKKLIYS